MSKIILDRETRNADAFISNLYRLSKAGVGVVLTRTKEPYRLLGILKEQILGNNTHFKFWDTVHGWHDYDPKNASSQSVLPVQSKGDSVTAIMDALLMIDNPPRTTVGSNNRNDMNANTGFPSKGYYAMSYIHWALPKTPAMIQLLKQYAHKFSLMEKRIVLIAPPEFTLPQELEEDIVVLDFDLPSYAELREEYDGLQRSLDEKSKTLFSFSNDDVDRIVSASLGMTAYEFETACSRAIIAEGDKRKANDNYKVNADSIIKSILVIKTEVVKKSEVLELMPSDSMDDVGGLENLKGWIKKRKHCFSQEAKDFGVDIPKGIALIGPPGTGKSMIAKAIASELQVPLIKFDVSRVFNSLVGSSEQRVRAALKTIEAMAPCVAMMDEVDKAFDNRSSGGDSGVGKRILGAVLTWMQETKAPVFTVVTANNVGGLPAEFLRKGRLDEIFSVSMPNDEERKEIMAIHLKKRGQDPSKIKDLDDAVEGSEGYVPAELEAAIKESILEAFVKKTGGESGDVSGAMILEQLKQAKPLSVAFAEQFESMRVWADNNARPANSTTKQATTPLLTAVPNVRKKRQLDA